MRRDPVGVGLEVFAATIGAVIAVAVCRLVIAVIEWVWR